MSNKNQQIFRLENYNILGMFQATACLMSWFWHWVGATFTFSVVNMFKFKNM